MTKRFAYVCPQCLEVTWVPRTMILNAVRDHRRFKVCDDCLDLG